MNNRYPFSPKNWFRSSLALLFAAFFTLNLLAQSAPAKLWDKTFGGSNEDGLRSIQQTSDGGYILGGLSNSPISGDKSQACQGDWDYWVVKLDASGNKTWDKTFGGNNRDWFSCLQQTSDGGFILGGTSESGISGDKSQACQGIYDYWVVKLDANGNKLWDKTFGGNNADALSSLQQTSDGGFILGGQSPSGISGDKTQASKGIYDFWVVKLDASGNKLWDKTIGGSSNDQGPALQQTSDGGYILGGFSNSPISGDKTQGSKGWDDYWVVKLDSNGNKLWDRTLGGSSDDYLSSLKQTYDGGYILGGTSDSGISGDKSQSSRGGEDYWVIKLDSFGNKSWDKTFGGSVRDELSSLQQTTDGGFILGGYSMSGISGDRSQANKGFEDYWVVKLDANGNKTWDKAIGGSNESGLTCLQQTLDGGYIFGGNSNCGIGGDKSQACQGAYDYWIVKLGAQAPYLPIDVAVSAIVSVNSGCLTNQETITITVNNFGTTSQSNIPVSYRINNGTPINEVVPGPLAPNASVSYSFTTKANLSASGTYNIEAKANLAGDALLSNNTFTKNSYELRCPGYSNCFYFRYNHDLHG